MSAAHDISDGLRLGLKANPQWLCGKVHPKSLGRSLLSILSFLGKGEFTPSEASELKNKKSRD